MTEEQWSPAQIVGWLCKHDRDSVCVETIYAYIRADKQNGGDLWKPKVNESALRSSVPLLRNNFHSSAKIET